MTATTQTVTHTTTTLKVSHESTGDGHSVVYKLDGTESQSNTAQVQSVSRVAVGQDKLTISRVATYGDGRVRETTQVWSFDAAGNLVIDATDGLKGATPVTRRQVYRKR